MDEITIASIDCEDLQTILNIENQYVYPISHNIAKSNTDQYYNKLRVNNPRSLRRHGILRDNETTQFLRENKHIDKRAIRHDEWQSPRHERFEHWSHFTPEQDERDTPSPIRSGRWTSDIERHAQPDVLRQTLANHVTHRELPQPSALPEHLHKTWLNAWFNRVAIKYAGIKCYLLTVRYNLQWNNYQPNQLAISLNSITERSWSKTVHHFLK